VLCCSPDQTRVFRLRGGAGRLCVRLSRGPAGKPGALLVLQSPVLLLLLLLLLLLQGDRTGRELIKAEKERQKEAARRRDGEGSRGAGDAACGGRACRGSPALTEAAAVALDLLAAGIIVGCCGAEFTSLADRVSVGRGNFQLCALLLVCVRWHVWLVDDGGAGAAGAVLLLVLICVVFCCHQEREARARGATGAGEEG